MNIEIQIKIGELVIGYEEARELYAKLRTVFGPPPEPIFVPMKDRPTPHETGVTHAPYFAPTGQPIPAAPPVPIGTLSTPEGAVAVLKDSYVPPAGQVDSGALCP